MLFIWSIYNVLLGNEGKQMTCNSNVIGFHNDFGAAEQTYCTCVHAMMKTNCFASCSNGRVIALNCYGLISGVRCENSVNFQEQFLPFLFNAFNKWNDECVRVCMFEGDVETKGDEYLMYFCMPSAAMLRLSLSLSGTSEHINFFLTWGIWAKVKEEKNPFEVNFMPAHNINMLMINKWRTKLEYFLQFILFMTHHIMQSQKHWPKITFWHCFNNQPHKIWKLFEIL